VKIVMLAAAGLILVGCGFYHWHKDGADGAAFQRDGADCQQQQQAGGKWEDCMTGKGWIYSGGW
jgi:hypothetical protein